MASHNLRLLMMFRGCRLCGSGGGVKFPVAREEPQLQPLKHKIKEAVGIEIKPNDKMPPLVCEVCLDKVLEFYDFKIMCQKTEETNRKNLNLYPAKRPRCEGECIFGVTERIFSDEAPSTSQQQRNAKKRKSAPLPQISKSAKVLRRLRAEVSEPQLNTRTRSGLHSQERAKSESTNSDDECLARKKGKPKQVSFSIETRRKKSASPLPTSTPTPAKRAKKAVEQPAQQAKSAKLTRKVSRGQPEAAKPENKRITAGAGTGPARNLRGSATDGPAKAPAAKASKQKGSAAQVECEYCGLGFKSGVALYSHKRVCHLVRYTDVRLTCNACALWFTSVGDTKKHHAWHRSAAKPYRCAACTEHFAVYRRYTEHRQTSCKLASSSSSSHEIKFNVPKEVIPKCKLAFVVLVSFDKILPRSKKINKTTYKGVDESHSFAPGIVYPLRRPRREQVQKSRVPTLFSLSFRALSGMSTPAVSRLFQICIDKINACVTAKTSEADGNGLSPLARTCEAVQSKADDDCDKGDADSLKDDRSRADANGLSPLARTSEAVQSKADDDCDKADADSLKDDRSKADANGLSTLARTSEAVQSKGDDDCDKADADSLKDDRSKADANGLSPLARTSEAVQSKADDDCDKADADSPKDDRSKADGNGLPPLMLPPPVDETFETLEDCENSNNLNLELESVRQQTDSVVNNFG